MFLKICSECSALVSGSVIVAVATGTMVGTGILCCYGLEKIFQRDPMNGWHEHVSRRMNTTFMYLGGSVGLTVVGGVVALKSALVTELRNCASIWVDIGICSVMVGSWLVCRDIRYEPFFSTKKHISWAFSCGVTGLFLTRLTGCVGRVMVMAGLFTAVHVGAYFALATFDAYYFPNRPFLTMGRTLKVGLVVVPISFVEIFVSILLSGGLALLSLNVLHDTQKLVAVAEGTPKRAPFDPINEQMSLFSDAFGIFLWHMLFYGAVVSRVCGYMII